MPVQKCTKDGKSGFRWRDEGKCYTGPDAKKKALEQGRAIKSQQSKGLIEKVADNLNAKWKKDTDEKDKKKNKK